MRNSFIKILEEQAEINKDLILLTGDLGFSVFENFKKKFPDKFFNVGISEQNMMGLAAGLALSGKKVFVYSIIPFVTYRCLEQIRNDICYHNLGVVIVGVGSGVSYGSLGSSHHAIEDIGALKSIPNINILSPSDPNEAKQLIIDSCSSNKPTYIRLGKNNEPIFNMQKIEVGKAYFIEKGSNIALVTYGNIIEEVVKAGSKLKNDNIHASIISVPTIKPLDILFFQDLLKTHKYIVIIEEHNHIGGLGDSIFSLNKNNENNNIFEHIAINDKFVDHIGSNTHIRKKIGLDSDSIYTKVKLLINKN